MLLQRFQRPYYSRKGGRSQKRGLNADVWGTLDADWWGTLNADWWGTLYADDSPRHKLSPLSNFPKAGTVVPFEQFPKDGDCRPL